MRILLIHQYFLENDDPGGSRFNEMTRIWAEAGHNITVLAGRVNYLTGKIPNKYKRKISYTSNYSDNLKVVRCYVTRGYNKNFIGRLWAYFSFVFSSTLVGLFKLRNKYDVLIVTSPPLFVGLSGYIISKIKRIPMIFEIRDLWPESAIETGVLKNKMIIKLSYFFEKLIYRHSKLINVLTPAFKTTLIENKGISSDKVIYIPNASDFTLTDELLDKFNIDKFRQELNIEDCFVVIYVGAHGVANHLEQLIDAAELLLVEKIKFLLIGDGMLKGNLIKEVKKRNISNVTFIDPVPRKEVFKYILASDLGASVLKKVETFKTIYSNKTFDYMACKKPVLMAIDGISKKLVEDAKCGIYVEPENPDEIAKGILKIRDGEDLIRMGENGYFYARQHFDRDVVAKEYLKHLASV